MHENMIRTEKHAWARTQKRRRAPSYTDARADTCADTQTQTHRRRHTDTDTHKHTQTHRHRPRRRFAAAGECSNFSASQCGPPAPRRLPGCSLPAERVWMDISDDEGEGSQRADSLASVLTPGGESLTSDGSGPSRGPKRPCADHDNATVRGVSARTATQPLSLDGDGDACLSLSSEGSLTPVRDVDSDEVPGVSPRVVSPGSAAGPALRPAPRPLGCGQAALPAFGWTRGQVIDALRPPRLHTCPGLKIVLKPGPGPSRPPRRSALLLPHGGAVVVQRYGTPRSFSCSQITSRKLTVRNHLELPTVLHFDEAHRQAVGEGWESRVVASPDIVEWLMGVLPGWTSPQPLAPSVVASHALGAPSAASVSAAAASREAGGVVPHAGGARRRTLSLFSGCGALDWALLDRCWPVAYCESCSAAARVLRLRMADGALPHGPIHADIRELQGGSLRGQVDGIVMGFPCQDISVAGQRLGFDGSRSSLVFEALRLADETGCSFIFMENVANILRMPGVWRPLFDAFAVRGFALRWCTVSASSVGAPQRRARWFALAQRGGGLEQRPDALPDVFCHRSQARAASILTAAGRPRGGGYCLGRSTPRFASV